jgi:hypothetical protein
MYICGELEELEFVKVFSIVRTQKTSTVMLYTTKL